jgi:hypothetical protein
MAFTSETAKIARAKAKPVKKGNKQIKTVIKQLLSDRIEQFDNQLYDKITEYLNSKKYGFYMTKEVLKYRLPVVTRLQGDKDLPININVNVTKYV